jgi:hypothetical protein
VSIRARLRIRAGIVSVIVAALAACVLFPIPALASDPVLEVVQVGWDGQIVAGSWSPVRVRLTGGGADLVARVEVVSSARVQFGPQGSTIEYPTGAYGQEVALPAGVAKDVTLWVPGDPNVGTAAGAAGSVRLVASGRTIAEEQVEFRTAKTPFWPLIAVLADSPAVARAISVVEMPVQGLPVPLSVARLTAADIPPSAERLGALSALVVQGNAAASLTTEQRVAVQQWIAAGGHLLLAGGPDAARTASVLPSGSLPVTFSGADGTADLSALAPWAGVKGQPPATGPAAHFSAERGSLLAGSPDRPLAWRMGVGQGTITLLAADPGLEPLASWQGTPLLLQKALEPALPNVGAIGDKLLYLQMQQRDILSQLQGAVDALPSDALPGWQTAALLLGVFLLVVGPILHFVLSRIDRRTWIWVIVPATASILAAGMYYVGVGRDGRDVLVNVVSHVRLDPDGGPASQGVMAGFYAPTYATLSVDVPGDLPVRPGTSSSFQPYSSYGGAAAPASTEPPFHVISGRDTRVEFESGQWGMRTVSVSRALENAGAVATHLELDGGIIKGTLRNDTPYLLEDAGVVVGQGVAKLGTLAPGQTASFVLDPGSPSSPFAGNSYPVSWRLFGTPRGSTASGAAGAVAVSRVYSAPGLSSAMPVAPRSVMIPEQLDVPQDPETQRRIRLMDPFVNVPRMGPGAQSMPLTFMAFTRQPIGKELLAATGHPSFYLNFLEQPLRLELPPGPFAIPPAMSTAEVVSQNGGLGGGGDGIISWVQLQSGSVVYEFRPPLPAKSQVDALSITTRQMGQAVAIVPGKGMAPPSSVSPGPAEAGVFAVYNWQSAAWEPLAGGREEVRLQPATQYVGPDGSVKLQVVAGLDRVVMFLQPELMVEGRVSE